MRYLKSSTVTDYMHTNDISRVTMGMSIRCFGAKFEINKSCRVDFFQLLFKRSNLIEKEAEEGRIGKKIKRSEQDE